MCTIKGIQFASDWNMLYSNVNILIVMEQMPHCLAARQTIGLMVGESSRFHIRLIVINIDRIRMD